MFANFVPICATKFGGKFIDIIRYVFFLGRGVLKRESEVWKDHDYPENAGKCRKYKGHREKVYNSEILVRF